MEDDIPIAGGYHSINLEPQSRMPSDDERGHIVSLPGNKRHKWAGPIPQGARLFAPGTGGFIWGVRGQQGATHPRGAAGRAQRPAEGHKRGQAIFFEKKIAGPSCQPCGECLYMLWLGSTLRGQPPGVRQVRDRSRSLRWAPAGRASSAARPDEGSASVDGGRFRGRLERTVPDTALAHPAHQRDDGDGCVSRVVSG